MLCIPSLAKFLHELSQRHFSKIVSDSSHPLFSRIAFNNCRMSSRNNPLYKHGRFRTQKRAKSFFLFFMSEHNRWFCIYLFIFCLNLLVNIRYYCFCDRECEIKLNWTLLIQEQAIPFCKPLRERVPCMFRLIVNTRFTKYYWQILTPHCPISKYWHCLIGTRLPHCYCSFRYQINVNIINTLCFHIST